MFKIYYNLIKPGIIYGNAITAAAGFFMAAKGHINWFLFFALLIGLSFFVASACVINNICDRDIDQRMERTKNRAIVTRTVSKKPRFHFRDNFIVAGDCRLTSSCQSISAYHCSCWVLGLCFSLYAT